MVDIIWPWFYVSLGISSVGQGYAYICPFLSAARFVERVVLLGAPISIKDENWETARKVYLSSLFFILSLINIVLSILVLTIPWRDFADGGWKVCQCIFNKWLDPWYCFPCQVRIAFFVFSKKDERVVFFYSLCSGIWVTRLFFSLEDMEY